MVFGFCMIEINFICGHLKSHMRQEAVPENENKYLRMPIHKCGHNSGDLEDSPITESAELVSMQNHLVM